MAAKEEAKRQAEEEAKRQEVLLTVTHEFKVAAKEKNLDALYAAERLMHENPWLEKFPHVVELANRAYKAIPKPAGGAALRKERPGKKLPMHRL